jgi:hypothetical protein
MKTYIIFRNHWKITKVIHFGVNISCCFKTLHATISLSLFFITIGFSVYKQVIDIDDPKQPWN